MSRRRDLSWSMLNVWVSIINERKHQSNFQLIIITHDETFLAKLGQNNIMQHYWYVD